MNAQRVSGMLGLCNRAGKLRCGESAVEKLAKYGGTLLVLIDQGMSQRSRKDIEGACGMGNVPMFELPEDMIGDSIGKPGRMAAAIMDHGFAAKIRQLIESE